MNKVLIIDDDEELCELVSEYLSVEGFEVSAVHNGEAGLSRARTGNYDLAILDVMMPKMNGFDVLRNLRETSQLPVVGLEIGADDYLPKPFNPRELVARIRAVLRRASGESIDQSLPEKLTVDDLEMSTTSRSATIDGEPVVLTSLEFDLLAALVRHAGNVVKKEFLSETVLERELSPYDRSLDMHISNLRKKLGLHSDGSERIKTVRSVGYIYTVK
jgi:two-component system response regulator CpxR